SDVIKSSMVSVIPVQIAVDVRCLVCDSPLLECCPPDHAGHAPATVTVSIPCESAAARARCSVLLEECLVSASEQHLSLRGKLIGCTEAHAHLARIQQLLKQGQKQRMRGSSTKTPKSSLGQRRVDRDKSILADIEGH